MVVLEILSVNSKNSQNRSPDMFVYPLSPTRVWGEVWRGVEIDISKCMETGHLLGGLQVLRIY